MIKRMREDVERVERAECYWEGLGLSPEQREFHRTWTRQRDFQFGKHDIPYMAIGFKPRPFMDPVNGRHAICPFGPDRLIVPVSTVSVVSVTRVPNRHWVGASQRRRWRWNCLVHPLVVQDGELIVAAAYTEKRAEQYDCALLPVQDCPVVDVIHFDEQATIPFDSVLRSPIAGRFGIRRSELHLDLTVGGMPVYRIDIRDSANVLLQEGAPALVVEGKFVKPGDALASLSGKVTYGQVRLRHWGEPVMNRISGDLFPATRKQPLLRLVNKMTAGITDAGVESSVDLDRQSHVPEFRAWAPRHLVQLDADTLSTLRVKEDWQATDRLKLDILNGLRPNGLLQEHYPITPDEYSWEQLQVLLGPSLAVLEETYLSLVAIRNGPLWQGEGALLDSQYLPSNFAAKHAVGHWLDLRPGMPYFDPAYGFIAGPPIRHDDWADLARFVNGVGYDFRPAGNRYSVRPIQQRWGSRRRCREVAA